LADQAVGVFVQTELTDKQSKRDDHRDHYLVASLALQGIRQAVLGFAFHQRQYRAFVFTAYDQISFPISETALRVHTRGAFVDAHAVWNDSPAIFATEATSALLSRLAQVKVKSPAVIVVAINMLMHAFRTDYVFRLCDVSVL
jgi:hypothetical protein